MDNTFKHIKDNTLNYSEVDHIKPVRIIIHDDISKSINKLNDNDDSHIDREFEEKYNWLFNWLFKK